MANYTTTPNMGLILPTPTVDPGPDYAINQNTSFSTVDTHDHTPGKGVPVTPSGININSDLTFASKNATTLRSVRFSPQVSAINAATDIGCLYELGVDLYYIDGSGNQVRITQSGNVAGTPGSIANLASPASASYVSASSSFVFQSNSNVAANLDGRNLILRNSSASSFGQTIAPHASLSADQTFTLPNLPAANNSFITIDTSGGMGAAFTYDGVTLTVASNKLIVATGGITTTQLATGAVLTVNIADANVTTAKLATQSVTQVKKSLRAVSSAGSDPGVGGVTLNSPANFTISSTFQLCALTTLTTLGNPVFIQLQPTNGVGQIIAGASGDLIFVIQRDGVTIAQFEIQNPSSTTQMVVPPSVISYLDTGASAVGHSYSVLAKFNSGSGVINAFQIVAYEL